MTQDNEWQELDAEEFAEELRLEFIETVEVDNEAPTITLVRDDSVVLRIRAAGDFTVGEGPRLVFERSVQALKLGRPSARQERGE